MAALKTTGILSLAALSVMVPLSMLRTPDYWWRDAGAIGETAGGMIGLTLMALLGATIAKRVARQSETGPLLTGLTIILIMGAANLAMLYQPVERSVASRLRASFIAGCVEKANSQGILRAAGIGDTAIQNYCACVHNNTMTDITPIELAEAGRTQMYPQRILHKIPGSVASCSAIHLSTAARQ